MTHHRRPSLALALSRLRRIGGPNGPTMAEAADHLAERSALLMIVLVAAISLVPSPGLPLGLVGGTIIVWLAVARLSGRASGRLPRMVARTRLPRSVLDAALRRVIPTLRRIERRSAERLHGLASGPGAVLALLSIVVQAVLLALPLPFGNLPPAVAILVLAAGLLWRDGLGVLIGHLLSVASMAILGGIVWSIAAVIA